QSIAIRLVLWRRAGRPPEESNPLVARIVKRQNPDGGWSQTKGMASDAWATGQALYALAHAGLKSDNPVITPGQSFLIKAQRDDGGWVMTSRPIKPGGAGSKSLIPITGAGSAWGVLGLVRTAKQPAGEHNEQRADAGDRRVPVADRPEIAEIRIHAGPSR